MINWRVLRILRRFITSFRFRLQPLGKWYQKKVVGPVRGKYGFLSRRLEYPLGIFTPSRQKEVFVSRPSALGDVLLCTPALREFKKKHPDIKINFYTNYEVLVRGLPYIDAVYPYDQRPWDGIEFRYEDSIPTSRHIAKIFGDQLNIDVTDTSPDCAISQNEIQMTLARYSRIPRPWFVVSRSAGPWTPNKEWSSDYWDKLIPKLTGLGSVFELGSTANGASYSSVNYVNLTGETSLSELISIIACSDLNISIDSGQAHIAAGLRVPSVVIFGGYVPAASFGHEVNINLGSDLDCSPCWLRTPCPIQKKCLVDITPEIVLAAVRKLCDQKQVRSQKMEWSLNYAPTSV